MGSKSKRELEADNAAMSDVLDALDDVLDDDELSAAGKVVAVQEELDRLADEDEEEDDGEDDE